MDRSSQAKEPASPDKPSLKLSVASYNIHHCRGLDGRYRPERTAEVLSEIDADIIGLQEVNTRFDGQPGLNQLEYLAYATGLNIVDGPTMVRGKGYYGNAILTKYPPASTRRVDLSLPGCEPRGMVDIVVNLGGASVSVITTHLGLSRSERCVQIERLLSWINNGNGNGDGRERVVIMGDFNEWWSGSLAVKMLEKQLGKIARIRTFPTLLPLFGIDWIHTMPQHALISAQRHSTPTSRLASDHLPIKAVIEWNLNALDY